MPGLDLVFNKHLLYGPKYPLDTWKHVLDARKYPLNGPKHALDGPKYMLDAPQCQVLVTKCQVDVWKYLLVYQSPGTNVTRSKRGSHGYYSAGPTIIITQL